MYTNKAKIWAEGMARGHRGQRLEDFVVGWFRNSKTGTGRRSKLFCKGRLEDGEQFLPVKVETFKAKQLMRKMQGGMV